MANTFNCDSCNGQLIAGKLQHKMGCPNLAPKIGDRIVCAETGESFVVEPNGCTFNYATSSDGEYLSDVGVDIQQRRALLDHSTPYTAYVSGDGKYITGWKGNALMTVTHSRTIKLTRWSFTHGRTIQSIVAQDVHGAFWYGRGNPGICITLRAYNAKEQARLKRLLNGGRTIALPEGGR